MRPDCLRSAALGLALAAAAGAPAAIAAEEYRELQPGLDLIVARDWDEAEDWFYAFTRENPQHAEGRRKQTYVELHRPGGDIVKARKYVEAAVSLEPDEPIGLMLLGRTCVIAGDDERAASAFDALIGGGEGERDPIRSNAVHLARFSRGLMHLQAGELDDARAMFERVLRREPQHAFAAFELGLMERDAGNVEAAVERFRQAEQGLYRWAPLEIWAYPQDRYTYIRDDVRFELARTLVAGGKPDEARPLLEPLVELSRARNGSQTTAARKSERALIEIPRAPRFEDALFGWGEMLVALDDKRGAKKAFKEFARMRIGSRALKDEARRLSKELR
jgi:tetratricopeptide (TPR) repeat protein